MSRFTLCTVLALVCLPASANSQAPGEDEASAPQTAAAAVLTIKGGLPESVGQAGIFGELSPNLAALMRRLEDAAQDAKLRAVVLRIRSPQIGRGKLSELSAAIGKLRDKGKYVVAQLETASSSDYLLAVACDQIVMPESGTVIVPGVRAEVSYYRGLLDLLGVQADMMQVGDFKGAAEPYTRTTMSEAFRQQYQRVVDDFFEQMIETIASRRNLDPARVRELVDVGVFTPRHALDAGLLDQIAYEDELAADLAEKLAVDEVELLADYGKKQVKNDFSGMLGMMKLFEMMMGVDSKGRSSSKKKIAVIYVNGVIMPGKNASSLAGIEMAGSDTVIKAIRTADEDETVAGIVLRVDSPGGSSLVSDLIWRALKKCGKPTVASMGDTAASGGYYISMACDKIYAEPGTLTGSIGVVGGKFSLGGLYEKIGLNTEVISRGKNSGVLSLDQPFSQTERGVFNETMREVYEQFVRKTAEGRGLAVERLEELAGGRIWTGRQAAGNGLVDAVGTLDEAIAELKQLASLPADEELERMVLPRPTSFFDQLLDGDVQMRSGSTISGRFLGDTDGGGLLPRRLAAQLREFQQLERLAADPVLMLLPHRIQIR